MASRGSHNSFQEEVAVEFADVVRRGNFQHRDESPQPPIMDIAAVTLANDHIELRIVRERSAVTVDVASPLDERQSYPLSHVIRAITGQDVEDVVRTIFEYAKLVEQNLDVLLLGFGPDKLSETLAACERAYDTANAAALEWASKLSGG